MDYRLFYRQTVFINMIYPYIVKLKQGENLLFASRIIIDQVDSGFTNGNN